MNNNEEDNEFTLHHVVTTIMNAIVVSYTLGQALSLGHFNTIKFVLLLFRAIELYPKKPNGGRSRRGSLTLAQKRINWVKQFITQNELYTPNGSANGALLVVVADADIDSVIQKALNTVLQSENSYDEKIEDKASEEDANGVTRIEILCRILTV